MKPFEWGVLAGVWIPWLLYRTVRWADDYAKWKSEQGHAEWQADAILNHGIDVQIVGIPRWPGRKPRWSLV